MHDRPHSKPDVKRTWAAAACLVSVGLCLAYAWVRIDLPPWWKGHGGGIPYVLFWITLGFVLFPFRRRILPIVLAACLMTCLLEFLQLWKPDWLMQIRGTRFGAALLGSGFDWNDFPPYFMGAALGAIVLVALSTGFSETRDRSQDTAP